MAYDIRAALARLPAPKKTIEDLVWPVHNYTEKISLGVKTTFQQSPTLAFNIKQVEAAVRKGYPWLAKLTKRQRAALNMLIGLDIRRLIQAGQVTKVTSNVTVGNEWMATKELVGSGYMSLVGDEYVAHTAEASKGVSKRPVNRRKLQQLNLVKK